MHMEAQNPYLFDVYVKSKLLNEYYILNGFAVEGKSSEEISFVSFSDSIFRRTYRMVMGIMHVSMGKIISTSRKI